MSKNILLDLRLLSFIAYIPMVKQPSDNTIGDLFRDFRNTELYKCSVFGLSVQTLIFILERAMIFIRPRRASISLPIDDRMLFSQM